MNDLVLKVHHPLISTSLGDKQDYVMRKGRHRQGAHSCGFQLCPSHQVMGRRGGRSHAATLTSTLECAFHTGDNSDPSRPGMKALEFLFLFLPRLLIYMDDVLQCA